MKNKKQAFVFFGVFFGALFLLLMASGHSQQLKRLPLDGNWDETVVTLSGEAYSLRQLAFYIAYEESTVEEQARIYDSTDTNIYWNMHTNGQFVKLAARDTAMDMAIHDFIFYKLAKKDGIKLNEEEKNSLVAKQGDFWSDLTTSQQQILEPVKEDMMHTMELMAISQKEQEITAQLNGTDYESYSIEGEGYQKLLSEYDYRVNKDIWESLEFGNLTISHGQ